MILKNRHYTIGDTALSRILDITDIKRKDPNFANAREIRNILDQVIMCQNLRCAGSDDTELGIVDVNKYIQDSKINLPTSGTGTANKVLTGEEEVQGFKSSRVQEFKGSRVQEFKGARVQELLAAVGLGHVLKIGMLRAPDFMDKAIR